MFLQWIAKCELVPLSADTYVLKKFSEKCQRTICSMVVGFLSGDGVDLAETLPTGHHIRWSMEIIGHSFALGLDDAEVIAGAIRIYERWLGVDAQAKTRDQRPACMHKVEQAFVQDLLGQMTLLFEERPEATRGPTDALLQRHVQLCGRVLDIFEAVAKRRGGQLAPATWDRLIRLLLGAADGVLHGSRSALGNHLCGPLVRILFELYLRSLPVCGPRGELWNLLQKFYRRWTHRLLVLEQWNAVTLALTRAMMRHLQTLDPRHEIELYWAENRLQSKVEVEASLVAYAWYRLLRVVGHPTGFSDPDVYLTAIKGISRLADEFTKVEQTPVVQWDQVLGALTSAVVGTRDTVDLSMLGHPSEGDLDKSFLGSSGRGGQLVKRTRAPPDVNAILRLLGPWLFDACLSRGPRFNSCRSEALRCLGKLICRFSGGRSKRIHWAYAMRCVMAVQSALMEEDDRIVASAVYNWSKVFSLYGNHTLRGAVVVTGPFHRAVERLFRVCERSGADEAAVGGIPVTLLRRACIDACSSLLTLHTHLPRALVKEAERSLVPESMSGIPGLYSSLPKYTSSQVVALLVNAFKMETDPTNLQMMLWLLTVAIQQEASYWSMGLASSRNSQVPVTILHICTVINKAGRHKAPVMFTAFECLRHLSLVSGSLFEHATSSVVHLVNACCDFITASAPVLRSNRAPFFLDELMGAAYRCITEWVGSSPLLLSRPPVVSKIVGTVIDSADRLGSIAVKGSTAPIRDASQKLLNVLLKHHSASSRQDDVNFNEKSALKDICKRELDEPHLHCRFFAINKHSVLTVIEKPPTDVSPAPETIFIIRDSSGRYVWRAKPRFCDGPRLRSTQEYEEYNEKREQQLVEDVDVEPTPNSELPSHDKKGDPLLLALRQTHQTSSLMSWQTGSNAPNGSADPARGTASLLVGEGNTGLSSVSERKASAIGREDREIQDVVFTNLMSAQSQADRAASTSGHIALITQYRRCMEPQTPQKDPALESWEVSRRMMTELGFLSVRNWGSLFAMKSCSGELLRDLEDLDKLPLCEVFEFGIAYARSQGSEGGFDNVQIVNSVDMEVGITDVSVEYEKFISALGERVPLGRETGSKVAHLPASSRFEGDVVYHSHHSGEVCFYVPTFPIKDRVTHSFVESTSLLERANVLIVWNETQLNYRPGSVLWESTFKLPTPSTQVVLIIDPLDNDLYCVRLSHEGSPLFNHRDVLAREDDNYVDEGEVHCARVLGPLQDGMVVNGSWLAPLVRQTAINATMIARAYHRYQHAVGATTLAPPEGPEWNRGQLLSSIIDKYMRPQLPGEFYGGLFNEVTNYGLMDEDARSSASDFFGVRKSSEKDLFAVRNSSEGDLYGLPMND